MTVPGSVFPPRLHRGDTVCVIAPAGNRPSVSEYDHSALIEARFAELGLRLTYGEHVDEQDDFGSSPVASRLADLHAAFADPGVAAVITVIGGFNSNELLPHIDWDLIAANPTVSAATPTSPPCRTRCWPGPGWSRTPVRTGRASACATTSSRPTPPAEGVAFLVLA